MEPPERLPDSTQPWTIRPDSIELIDPKQPRERVVYPAQAAAPPRRNQKGLAVILIAATCVSTFIAGMVPGDSLAGIQDLFRLLPYSGENAAEIGTLFRNGAIFSVALMGILLFHEMGHYLQSLRYKVPASPPFFVPLPISPFGTLGAVIVQAAGFADRKALFDIAITGPLAGLAVTLPVTYFGVLQSSVVDPVPGEPVYGMPLLLAWIIEYVHGTIPAGAVYSTPPLLFAGWVGIFITALNLIPIGQLDGGHILYALIGRRAHSVAIILLGLAVGFMAYTHYYAYGLMIVLLLIPEP
jgi:membrane-associated protease RseP (regulator of RpoE activity)